MIQVHCLMKPYALGVPALGVLVIRALLVGVCIGAPPVWKLTYWALWVEQGSPFQNYQTQYRNYFYTMQHYLE